MNRKIANSESNKTPKIRSLVKKQFINIHMTRNLNTITSVDEISYKDEKSGSNKKNLPNYKASSKIIKLK